MSNKKIPSKLLIDFDGNWYLVPVELEERLDEAIENEDKKTIEELGLNMYKLNNLFALIIKDWEES